MTLKLCNLDYSLVGSKDSSKPDPLDKCDPYLERSTQDRMTVALYTCIYVVAFIINKHKMVMGLILISLGLQVIYGIGSLGELWLLRILGAHDEEISKSEEIQHSNDCDDCSIYPSGNIVLLISSNWSNLR